MRTTRASFRRRASQAAHGQSAVFDAARTERPLRAGRQRRRPAGALCDWLEMDDFVKFVNAQGPQTPRRISKLDVAFEKQLVQRNVRTKMQS
jgi:hypothetical protein